MSSYLPLFPLNLVAFPGEDLNLHIFEPRYKDLVADISSDKSTFGIPAFINDKIEYGTSVKLKAIHKRYDDGRLDISVAGQKIFKVKKFENPMPGKKYAGGLVAFIRQDHSGNILLKEKMYDLMERLFNLFEMKQDFNPGNEFNTYTLAHKIGLKVEQEYELIQLRSEEQRQKFIIDHLEKSLPILEQMEEAKRKIRANGHFKHLDALKF